MKRVSDNGVVLNVLASNFCAKMLLWDIEVFVQWSGNITILFLDWNTESSLSLDPGL